MYLSDGEWKSSRAFLAVAFFYVMVCLEPLAPGLQFIIEIIRYARALALAAAAIPVIALAILVSPLVISVALMLILFGYDPWDYIYGPINQRCQS